MSGPAPPDPPADLPAGHSGTAELVVTEADTARVMGQGEGDDFPAVFATARMIGLMEIAAARAMRRLLRPDQLSVGVSVDVEHTALQALQLALVLVELGLRRQRVEHAARVGALLAHPGLHLGRIDGLEPAVGVVHAHAVQRVGDVLSAGGWRRRKSSRHAGDRGLKFWRGWRRRRRTGVGARLPDQRREFVE